MRYVKFLHTIFCFLICVSVAQAKNRNVKTGLDVLQANGFAQLQGKKVGLITNPTGVNRNLITNIDLLHDAANVDLKVLFSPEHGIRGDHAAGERVATYVDAKTGLTVYSYMANIKNPMQKC